MNLWVRRQKLWNYAVIGKQRKKNEQVWGKAMWSTGHHERNNLWIIGVPEGEETEKKVESLLKK